MSTGRVERPIGLSSFEWIGGFAGGRIAANVTNYLKPFDIDSYVGMVEQKTHRAWWWIGEQPAKWLESAVLNSAWMGDETLLEKAREVLGRIAGAREGSGYVGITDPAVRTEAQPLRGMEAYELYFMLHGLCTAHEEWASRAALETARGLGDYLVATIGPGKAEFWPGEVRPPENKGSYVGGESRIAGHGVHYSLEGTLLIDPMLRLYEQTGERKYLEWCEWVISRIDVWSGWETFSKLDEVAAGRMGIDAVQPYVHSHTFHMNFLGFLRMYEITGERSYLAKVAGAWKDIAERQMYITGAVSVGEHYEKGYSKPITGHVVETCATMSWMEVTQSLLELTGEPHYGDAIERLMLNHVFAAQAIDGDCVRYHTPPNGTKHDYFHGPDCCTSSGHRMLSKLPTFIYGRDERGLFVNQYVASKARVDLGRGVTVGLHQATRYPEEETIVLKVDPSETARFVLRLRVPGWCRGAAVAVNGEAVSDVREGTYLGLERVWRAGDQVEIRFPMERRWKKRANHTKDRVVRLRGGAGEEMRESAPDPDAPYALVRGPVVYTYDTAWQEDAAAPAAPDVAVDLTGAPETEEAATPERAMGPAFSVELVTVDGGRARVVMVPFANVGRWYRDADDKPDVHSKALSYATWLPEANGPGWRARMEMSAEKRALLGSAIDYLEIGDGESEAAHEVTGGEAGECEGRAYRQAGAPGTIECTVAVSTTAASTMIVTYCEGGSGGNFDVFANDRLIGTERFEGASAEYFDIRYLIPFELVQGKTDAYGQPINSVRVKFAAHPGRATGRVCRVVVMGSGDG